MELTFVPLGQYDRDPIGKITYPTLKPWPRDSRRTPISLHYQNMVDWKTISVSLPFDEVDPSKRPTRQQLDFVASKYRRPATELKPDARVPSILWETVVYALLIFNLMARPNNAGDSDSALAALEYFKKAKQPPYKPDPSLPLTTEFSHIQVRTPGANV